MARATIADIASRAGVSKTAVSFVLNDRPGVSEPTRERVRAAAEDLGWKPSAAARALSTSTAQAIGLVIVSPFELLSHDTFYLQLIAGIEHALAESPVVLTLKIVRSPEEELSIIERWHAESRVDGLILVNPLVDDPRPDLVRRLGMPSVFIGAPPEWAEVSRVSVSDAETMRALLDDLRDLGHHSLAYVHTVSTSVHGVARLAAVERAADLGVEVRAQIPIDATGAARERGIREGIAALVRSGPPDVILCEDESLTLGVLDGLARAGARVPEDVGVVSWESSPGLVLRPPTVSSLERSPAALGRAAVEALDELRGNGRGAPGGPVVREIPVPRLVVRDSLRRLPERRIPPVRRTR